MFPVHGLRLMHPQTEAASQQQIGALIIQSFEKGEKAMIKNDSSNSIADLMWTVEDDSPVMVANIQDATKDPGCATCNYATPFLSKPGCKLLIFALCSFWS